jgi:hypothetical protein
MHPYRPLFVSNESRETPSSELRGIAVLLVVLGILRIVPALMREEPAGLEIALATAMLMLGMAILVRVSRLSSRLRDTWARRH